MLLFFCVCFLCPFPVLFVVVCLYLGLYCLRFPFVFDVDACVLCFLCDYVLVRCCLGYFYCLRL